MDSNTGAQDENGMTPLMKGLWNIYLCFSILILLSLIYCLLKASNEGDKETVQILIDIGCDIDAKDSNEWTALIYASYY